LDRKEKEALVSALTERFQGVPNAFLVNYRGLNVAQSEELRKKIRENDAEFLVVKNTLALRAITETPMEQLKDFFEGPTAVVLNKEDPIALAKIIKSFSKDYPVLTFKAAIAEGELINESEFKDFANLPSREALISKLLFMLGSSLSKLNGMMQAPLQNLMRLMNQVKGKPDGGEEE
jgi:large subunit ribosomal protein L10